MATSVESARHPAPAETSRRQSGVRRSVTPPPISRPMEPVTAGLSFLEGVACRRLCQDTLDAWIEHNLVAPGYVGRDFRIHEPLFGALPIDKGCGAFLPEVPPTNEISAMLVRARARVVSYLNGLIQTPEDDRFVHAAIFKGRVKRSLVGESMVWIPKPHASDSLSDVIASLFASDILGRRDYYASSLCVCKKCGKIRFDPSSSERHSCVFCTSEPAPTFVSRNEQRPVFVVDDDIWMLRGLQRLFSSKGLHVVTFDEPRRFLEEIPPGCSGCVVIDMQMPEMTGLQVLQELRRRGHDIPVIFLTGQSEPEVRLEALRNGAFDFLSKPWESSSLIGSVSRAMAQHQAKPIR